MLTNKTYHVISTTHWDREWLDTYQEFRIELVHLMKNLFKILETNPDYRAFHLDAQVLPLEDYLEVFPDDRPKIEQYVKEGRLLIGPWYVTPDNFMVSGETLIRNIVRGIRTSRKFGKCMMVGYNPCSNGQCSQLPQIFAGCGIDSVIFYRGVDRDSIKSEFYWEAPDGTRALANHLGAQHRANFYLWIWYPVSRGKQEQYRFPLNEYRCEQDAAGMFRMADDTIGVMHWRTNPEFELHHEHLQEGIESILTDVNKYSKASHVLFFQSCDSYKPHSLVTEVIKEADKLLPDGQIIHSTIPEWLDALKKDLPKNMPVVKGEMNSGIFHGLWSTRNDVKKRQDEVECALHRVGEPMAVMAWLSGAEYPAEILDRAWKLLLENTFHDQIEGCSVDRVHEDGMNRYEQCNDIVQKIVAESAEFICTNVNTSSVEDASIFLTVFNTLPHQRSGIVNAAVDFPALMGVTQFALCDMEGNEVPCVVTGGAERRCYSMDQHAEKTYYDVNRFYLAFNAEHIPAMGYKTFKLVHHVAPAEFKGSLSTGPNRMENEFLSVAINPDGTLRVTDKKSGAVYEKLHYFIDEGNIGDTYVKGFDPTDSEALTSSQFPVEIRLSKDTPLFAEYEIKYNMRVPESADHNTRKRSDNSKQYPIVSRISLTREGRRVDIETEINNNARDHRLRVCFPTGLKSNASYSETVCDIIERPYDGSNDLAPLSWFCGINDGEKGVSILAKGLREYEIIDKGNGSLALTLLRCYWKIHPSTGDIRYGGPQLQGKHTFRYSIYPYSGSVEESDSVTESREFNIPLRAGITGVHNGNLPEEKSFLSFRSKNVSLESLHHSATTEGAVMRLFNYNNTDSRLQVELSDSFKYAAKVNFLEEQRDKIAIAQNTLTMHLRKKEIATVLLGRDT